MKKMAKYAFLFVVVVVVVVDNLRTITHEGNMETTLTPFFHLPFPL